MKKYYLSLLTVSIGFLLVGCLSEKSNLESEALDYVEEPEITVKTPEEWLPLISSASLANEDITSYLDTRVCIPTSSEVCDENNNCKEAEPSVFLFVSSFEPSTGETLALTTNIYRCDDVNGCEKKEYASYFDAESNTERLQIRDHELSISGDQYVDESIVGLNTVTNSGKCYYRDELNIAEVKVESVNQYDKICEIDESNFGIDWIGINETFTLQQDTELRASPITMDCNVLDIVPEGEQISIQTETNGAVNPDESYIWVEVTYGGQTGWIRGDLLDEQFQR